MDEKMRAIKIYAGGKIKNSFLYPIQEEYSKRITRWSVDIKESTWKDFLTLSSKKKNTASFWIMLDEQGENLSSQGFKEFLNRLFLQAPQPVFFIGTEKGFPESLKQQGQFFLSFGKMTWPHLWARVLLLEQIYRSQQFLSNHPYSFL